MIDIKNIINKIESLKVDIKDLSIKYPGKTLEEIKEIIKKTS